MSDTVKREAVIASINTMYECCDTGDITDYRDLMLEAAEMLPSADRPQGEWVVTTLYASGKAPKTAVRCSECKRIPLWLGSPILPTKSGNLLEYCPHCGTKMK